MSREIRPVPFGYEHFVRAQVTYLRRSNDGLNAAAVQSSQECRIRRQRVHKALAWVSMLFSVARIHWARLSLARAEQWTHREAPRLLKS
jgi:hypothetical protein